jgi:hypothetical protein
MKPKPKTVGEVFSYWDTIPEMASDVGVPQWRASKWRQRGRIPALYWTSFVSAVERKGKDLCIEDLLMMHTRRRASASRASK